MIRKETSNFIKVIAIFLVIFGHLDLIHNGGIYGVSLFLIISGYGMYKSNQINGLKDFWIKRIKTVLIPYSVVSIIVFLLDYLLNGKKYNFVLMIITILGGGIVSPVDKTMWYITYILYWYLVFYILNIIFTNKKLTIMVSFIIGISMYIFINFAIPSLTVIKLYSIMFPTGMFLAYLSNFKYNRKYKLNISIISLIVCIFTYNINYGNAAVNPIFLVFICIFIIYLIEVFYKEKNFITYISNISFYMYLFEAILMWKFTYIFCINNYYISLIIYFFVLISISILFEKIFDMIYDKKILNKFKNINRKISKYKE